MRTTGYKAVCHALSPGREVRFRQLWSFFQLSLLFGEGTTAAMQQSKSQESMKCLLL